MAFRRTALALPTGLRGAGAQVDWELACCLWAVDHGWRLVYDPSVVVDHAPGPRYDADRRHKRAPRASFDAAYNRLAILLALRPRIGIQRVGYGLLVGERRLPGLVRVAVAMVRAERDVAVALMPSVRGQLTAVIDAARGRRVCMVGAVRGNRTLARAVPARSSTTRRSIAEDGSVVTRLVSALVTLCRELGGAWRITTGLRSYAQLCADLVALRVARLRRVPLSNALRPITLSDGHQLTYRLNRGDLQSLREVWMDEIYRPPFSIRADVIVDLGANIGLTTRWMRHRLGASHIVTVEASASNNDLLERNVPVGTQIIRAAVGPSDGIAHFANDAASNLGRVADDGAAVDQVSMHTVLDHLPRGRRVDLLKLDIEGGEQLLLTHGDLTWLDNVDAIIAEFHPELVDYQGLVDVLVSRGFDYLPAGGAWAGSMDAFHRPL